MTTIHLIIVRSLLVAEYLLLIDLFSHGYNIWIGGFVCTAVFFHISYVLLTGSSVKLINKKPLSGFDAIIVQEYYRISSNKTIIDTPTGALGFESNRSGEWRFMLRVSLQRILSFLGLPFNGDLLLVAYLKDLVVYNRFKWEENDEISYDNVLKLRKIIRDFFKQQHRFTSTIWLLTAGVFTLVHNFSCRLGEMPAHMKLTMHKNLDIIKKRKLGVKSRYFSSIPLFLLNLCFFCIEFCIFCFYHVYWMNEPVIIACIWVSVVWWLAKAFFATLEKLDTVLNPMQSFVDMHSYTDKDSGPQRTLMHVKNNINSMRTASRLSVVLPRVPEESNFNSVFTPDSTYLSLATGLEKELNFEVNTAGLARRLSYFGEFSTDETFSYIESDYEPETNFDVIHE
ncbi:hypothetical protein PCE1_004953 [Barthelona sp. PCE]